jgi:hypothetical protein
VWENGIRISKNIYTCEILGPDTIYDREELEYRLSWHNEQNAAWSLEYIAGGEDYTISRQSNTSVTLKAPAKGGKGVRIMCRVNGKLYSKWIVFSANVIEGPDDICIDDTNNYVIKFPIKSTDVTNWEWNLPDSVVRMVTTQNPNRVQLLGITNADTRIGNLYFTIDGKTYKKTIRVCCPKIKGPSYISSAFRYVYSWSKIIPDGNVSRFYYIDYCWRTHNGIQILDDDICEQFSVQIKREGDIPKSNITNISYVSADAISDNGTFNDFLIPYSKHIVKNIYVLKNDTLPNATCREYSGDDMAEDQKDTIIIPSMQICLLLDRPTLYVMEDLNTIDPVTRVYVPDNNLARRYVWTLEMNYDRDDGVLYFHAKNRTHPRLAIGINFPNPYEYAIGQTLFIEYDNVVSRDKFIKQLVDDFPSCNGICNAPWEHGSKVIISRENLSNAVFKRSYESEARRSCGRTMHDLHFPTHQDSHLVLRQINGTEYEVVQYNVASINPQQCALYKKYIKLK